MKLLATVLMSACLAVTGAAVAQEKKDAMAKPMAMTMKECQDYTAMSGKDAKMKDAKKDTMCSDMMKKDAGMMKKDDGMKKDAMKK